MKEIGFSPRSGAESERERLVSYLEYYLAHSETFQVEEIVTTQKEAEEAKVKNPPKGLTRR
jgi:hypothetical protein